ncbi:MAG: HD domain-containing protein [Fuerstiella sp.]
MLHPYASIPEIAGNDRTIGVIRVPVEQDIPLTDRVRAIVDTSEFQRLRQITQLALASRVYPGAIHSRFEHALGVYNNAICYLRQLGLDPRFAATVNSHDAEVLIAAALLHDVGHWPFCHPIEDLALPNVPEHEDFAKQFLGADSELAEVLREQWKIEPSEIIQVLVGKPKGAALSLRQSILSGPIDIDKMDYLNRDSQHCGVPYGRNFDRNRLIGSLIVNEAGDGLALTTKGKTAAEMMVFARYVMFSEVYWHHAVRAATTMFTRAFYELHTKLDLDELFQQNEPDMIATLRNVAKDSIAENLCEGLFGPKRLIHKRLREYSLNHRPDLYHALRQMPYPDLVHCSNRLAAEFRHRFGLQLIDSEVLIDAPPVHREVEFKVEIYDPAIQVYSPLNQISPIVASMSQTGFDDCVKRVRVCVSRDVKGKFDSPTQVDDILATLISQHSN